MFELLVDNETTLGRVVTSAAILLVAVVVALVIGWIIERFEISGIGVASETIDAAIGRDPEPRS